MINVQRSITAIAAISREFRFPLDHTLEDDSSIGLPEEGHGVVEFFHNLKLFMADQQQIIALINEECKARHQVKHNSMVKTHLFQTW
jgi:hypothetical protein